MADADCGNTGETGYRRELEKRNPEFQVRNRSLSILQSGILSHQTETGQSTLSAPSMCHLIIMLNHRVMMAEAQIVCLHSSNISVFPAVWHTK